MLPAHPLFFVFCLTRPSLPHLTVFDTPNRTEKGDRVDAEALEEFLRFWVAFSVIDEDGAGSVSVGDLKARRIIVAP